MASLPKFDHHKGPEGRRCGRILVSEVTCSLGKVLDISASGARISTPRHPGFPAGQKINVSIHSDPTGTFGVSAEIVRLWRTGIFRHECALRFVDPAPDVKRHLSTIAQTCGTRGVEWVD